MNDVRRIVICGYLLFIIIKIFWLIKQGMGVFFKPVIIYSLFYLTNEESHRIIVTLTETKICQETHIRNEVEEGFVHVFATSFSPITIRVQPVFCLMNKRWTING